MKRLHPIQISIPQPCSEDWNKMTPQEQGRFCDSCQKCVVDLTNFSDKELYQYLLANKGKKACGRFRTEQLNRPIQIPHQPHSQLYKWIIAAGLSLVFTIASDTDAFAQAPIKPKATITNSHSSTTVQHRNSDTFVLEELTITEYKEPLMSGAWTLDPGPKNQLSSPSKDSVTIKGNVTDDNDDPVTHATVTIRNGEKVIANTLTNPDGDFKIKLAATDTANANIFVNYIGQREHKESLSSKGTMKIKLAATDATIGLIEVIMIEHDPPLMNKYDGGHIKTIKSDEIEKGAY